MSGRIRKEVLIGGAALVASSLAWVFFRRRPGPPRMAPAQVVIDPSVYMQMEATQEPLAVPVAPVQVKFEPNTYVTFGYDSVRNEDPDVTVDDYMNLPLEGKGLTHENRHRFQDLEEGEIRQPKLMRFQFFRFRVLETRDAAAAQATIGGFQFMNGAMEVFHPDAKVWNPHTGERKPFFSREAWSDSDQKEFIVRFPVAVAVNRYKIQTSDQDQAFDPVRWRLEGSHNGTYWLPLDERSQKMPAERGAWLIFRMREILDNA